MSLMINQCFILLANMILFLLIRREAGVWKIFDCFRESWEFWLRGQMGIRLLGG